MHKQGNRNENKTGKNQGHPGPDNGSPNRGVEAYESISSRMEGFLYRCRNDSAYTMLIMTGRVESITGYKATDIIDNKRVSYVTLMHGDDADSVDAAIDTAVKNRKNWNVDYRLKTSSGDYVWVNESGGAVYDDRGEVVYLEGVVVDISERKKGEALQKERMTKIESSTKAVIKETKNIFTILRTLRNLSFNATIEAARAGEYGRSFSVVAEQVKSLADETEKSAKKISDLIEDLDSNLR